MRCMKLNLRDLFWLMLVVALALCWRMDHLRLQACRIRSRQVTDYLERVESLRVEWKGNEMRIKREL